MKLIGYVRVSTDAQRENTSTEAQVERLQAYCKAFNHKLVKVFKEVASGKDTKNRPVFNEALEYLHKADGLIATKLDRVARSTRDVLTLVEDVLKPENKALVLLDQNIDTSSPYGMMVLTMMAAVAQLERDVIRERTQGGREAKASKGGFAYGSPPYGFKSIDAVLVPVETEQLTIDLMRRQRRGGKSFNAIARMLNDQGIPSKRGGQWYAAQVQDVLGRLSKVS